MPSPLIARIGKARAAGWMTVLALFGPDPAPASTHTATPCDGVLGAVVVPDLVVPAWRTCMLDGTTIIGNVTIERGGTLRATGVMVGGDLAAVGARLVTLGRGARVDGSVRLNGGGGAVLADSTVQGELSIEAVAGEVSVASSRIVGDVALAKNLGGVELRESRIEGSLECLANQPAPRAGETSVLGERLGQCDGS